MLEQMVAHSQYCSSGDCTVEATARAVKDVKALSDSDQRVVFVVSDANLRRCACCGASYAASAFLLLLARRVLLMLGVCGLHWLLHCFCLDCMW